MSKKKRDKPNISDLNRHHRERKTLKPPFARLQNMSLQSWANDRMPKVLWALVLAGGLEREQYLDLFRSVLDRAHSAPPGTVSGLDHSHNAKLAPADFDTLFAPLLKHELARDLLCSLLLFDGLPDREHWQRHLSTPDDEIAFQRIASGIAGALDHQSEAATDCRWLRVCCQIAIGKMHFPEHLVELAREIIEFPNRGDLRSVRPNIRASESALGMGSDENDEWPSNFWKECWDKTHCIPAPRKTPERVECGQALRSLFWIYTNVSNHFVQTSKDTALDPRRDGAFGIVLYGITLAMRVMQTGDHARPEGRIVLRTLVESCLILSFLVRKDDPIMWQKYRDYGTGQAKLAFLKLYDLDDQDVPSFVNLDELEILANEDIWQEFSNIELGNWAGSDLRSISEQVGLKDIYDKYYNWPSGYVHAQWGAVRDTVFDLCLNPLHRYHRIPSLPRIDMPSVLPDVSRLINIMLGKLEESYPPFKLRVGAMPPVKEGAEGFEASVIES